jgi:excisionase family DNA binding protein
MPLDDWLTTHEAAELSGYTQAHIRLLIRKDEIDGKKWGRDWQVSRESLLIYLRKAETMGEKRGPKPEK